MREYIKKLQSKPEPVRKQIVVGMMAVSMFFVGIVFVYSLQSNMNGNEKSDTKTDSLAPFKLLGDSISETYNNMSASVGKISIQKDQSNENTLPTSDASSTISNETVSGIDDMSGVTEEAVYE